jgi:hypothetical protein
MLAILLFPCGDFLKLGIDLGEFGFKASCIAERRIENGPVSVTT